MLELKKESMGEALAFRANNILEACRDFIIKDQASYSEADRKVSETASLEKGIIEYWAEPKQTAHKSWKSICAKEKEMLEPIKEGSRLLSTNMAAYKSAFEKEEQKKRDELQEKAKSEARLEAFELAEQGADPIAAKAVMEMAEEAVPVAPVAELRGKTSFVQSYEVRLIPGEEWRIPKDLLVPTTPAQIKALEAKVKAQAKFTGGKPVQGFEIIPIQSARRRAI
tara:strand:+ start:151 stop:825 length:675 start_codon:yes stop_codon:yes gene_type:complete